MWTINKDYSREFAVWANKTYPFGVALVAKMSNIQSAVWHFTAFANEELTWTYVLGRLEDIYGTQARNNIFRIVSMTYQETCYNSPSGPVIRVECVPVVPSKYPEKLETPGILPPYNPETDDRYRLTKLSILCQIHELQEKLNTLETYIQRVL